jgi:hypothetical protein
VVRHGVAQGRTAEQDTTSAGHSDRGNNFGRTPGSCSGSRVVRRAAGRPPSLWLAWLAWLAWFIWFVWFAWFAWHSALRADSYALPRKLEALRQAAGVPGTVSVLRVYDVVVWMRHRIERGNRP